MKILWLSATELNFVLKSKWESCAKNFIKSQNLQFLRSRSVVRFEFRNPMLRLNNKVTKTILRDVRSKDDLRIKSWARVRSKLKLTVNKSTARNYNGQSPWVILKAWPGSVVTVGAKPSKKLKKIPTYGTRVQLIVKYPRSA